ncbi:MAG: hypothetical protein LBR07_00570, partial [Puniceicoccales bacterium]|nr:hypothetical protein [Puniceicoccales bacterium]
MVYSILANASAAEPTKLEVILEGFVGLFVVLFILSLLTLVLLALSKMTFLREKPPAAKLAPAAVPVPVAAGA